jgi:hypothetical protein
MENSQTYLGHLHLLGGFQRLVGAVDRLAQLSNMLGVRGVVAVAARRRFFTNAESFDFTRTVVLAQNCVGETRDTSERQRKCRLVKLKVTSYTAWLQYWH